MDGWVDGWTDRCSDGWDAMKAKELSITASDPKEVRAWTEQPNTKNQL